MIELDMKEKKYLQVSKHFQQINTTPIVTNDESKVIILFTMLCLKYRYFRHVIRSSHVRCFASYQKLAQNSKVI